MTISNSRLAWVLLLVSGSVYFVYRSAIADSKDEKRKHIAVALIASAGAVELLLPVFGDPLIGSIYVIGSLVIAAIIILSQRIFSSD